MIFQTLLELTSDLPNNARLLGLDVGSKTIGIAVSDSDLKVASSIKTIRRKSFANDVTKLNQIIIERQAGGLVLGLPVSMDGNEGPACQAVRQFAKNLNSQIEIGIAFWDERLSTSVVERLLIKEANLSRKRRSEVVDKMAATYILQGALDFLSN